jgi:hypothetical protein
LNGSRDGADASCGEAGVSWREPGTSFEAFSSCEPAPTLLENAIEYAKKESSMRMVVVAILAVTASAAMADELDDAHRLAISGRDTYWNCLAQEYNENSNGRMSEQDFTRHIADVCPSERQSFRVALVDYLTLQFPKVDADAHMTSANNAIALAQKDVTTAFARRKAASK